MKDVKCPYCDKEQDINHDDNYGYEEDTVHKQECGSCRKTFTYTTSIHFYYEPSKANCLNGGKHKKEQVWGVPKEFFVGVMRCSGCGEEFLMKEKERKIAIEKYWVDMDLKKGIV